RSIERPPQNRGYAGFVVMQPLTASIEHCARLRQCSGLRVLLCNASRLESGDLANDRSRQRLRFRTPFAGPHGWPLALDHHGYIAVEFVFERGTEWGRKSIS